MRLFTPSVAWFALAALTLGSAPAYAQKLITQAKVNTGNFTPGDAPGFPLTISVRGAYKLTGNLTVPNADTTAIQITADNVTLDLNGFGIYGPAVEGFGSGGEQQQRHRDEWQRPRNGECWNLPSGKYTPSRRRLRDR